MSIKKLFDKNKSYTDAEIESLEKKLKQLGIEIDRLSGDLKYVPRGPDGWPKAVGEFRPGPVTRAAKEARLAAEEVIKQIVEGKRITVHEGDVGLEAVVAREQHADYRGDSLMDHVKALEKENKALKSQLDTSAGKSGNDTRIHDEHLIAYWPVVVLVACVFAVIFAVTMIF